MSLALSLPSRSMNEAPRLHPVAASASRPSKEIWASATSQASFEQRVTDALVALKATTAAYAMHMSAADLGVIFEQLENIINVDDWHEEDEFPRLASFRDLLAWSIYANVSHWDSLGVDDDGDVLIAWHNDRLTLTANFDGHRLVRWASRYQGDDGAVAHANGDCSLRQFARQAKFYLQGEAADV